MHTFLKKLELQGFKSFAQKTDFEFPKRVVGVVGPNGSGKSNVIDALRWVLGEREAKQLRGDTLGNLIFAGTPKRAAVGFAKVTLIFDNREKLFSIDAPEVALSRRIDRSGNSQFFLQDAEIRLKDLQPILARARLGARGLTMIGQGQSDLFVRSSPDERRLMIEEVLGLREFRLKKGQAERQLASSEVNMEKVAAMLEELAPHLKFLRKQKTRFEKRAEIEHDLHNFENTYFAHHFHALDAENAKLKTPFEEAERARTAKEQEVVAGDRELRSVAQDTGDAERVKKLRESLTHHFGKRADLEKTLARAEAKLEFSAVANTPAERSAVEMKTILESVEEELRVMEDWHELDKIKQSLQRIVGRITQFFKTEPKADTKPLEGEIAKLKQELLAVEEEIQKIRADEEAIAVAQQNANKEFREKVEALEVKKNELRKLEQAVSQYKFDGERIRMRMDDLEREWAALGRAREELHTISEVRDIVEFGDLERKMLRLRGELAAIGEIDETLVKEANDAETRYEFLSKELEDLKNAVADLKTLIKELDHKIHADFKSAFSAISDEFNNYFQLMFGGGKAKMKLKMPEVKMQDIIPVAGEAGAEGAVVEEEKEEKKEKYSELSAGVEIEITIPRKKIGSLEMLSGGEKSLVSLAALFALISVSPPPFLVLDEIDAPLDEENARRFSDLVKEFSKKTQFIIVTHNRATMESADILYGVTMGDDGVSKTLSLKLDTAK